VQYTPFMEAQRLSRPDKVLYAYPSGMMRSSPEVEMRQVDNVLPDRQSSSDLSRQPEVAENIATTRPEVQFQEAISEDAIMRPDFDSHSAHGLIAATATSQVRTPETGNAELTTDDTSITPRDMTKEVAERSQ